MKQKILNLTEEHPKKDIYLQKKETKLSQLENIGPQDVLLQCPQDVP